jgi:hypothetical protein
MCLLPVEGNKYALGIYPFRFFNVSRVIEYIEKLSEDEPQQRMRTRKKLCE